MGVKRVSFGCKWVLGAYCGSCTGKMGLGCKMGLVWV